VILPYIEGLRFQELAERYNLYCTRMWEVHPKKDKAVERLLLQFEKKPGELIKEEPLIIQKEERNEWTEAYRELTGAFYLKM
jgi:tRNA1Val (adenine37-N6)-methyltransferase